MHERIYIKDLRDHIEKQVTIGVWVNAHRGQGKMVFFDFRDRTGKVQGVVLPDNTATLVSAKEMRPEWVLEVMGIVHKKPTKYVQAEKQNGDIELEVKTINVLAKAKELPFDKDTDINIDTYLDYLPLTLRTERAQAVFKVQATILKAFREFLVSEG